MIGGSTTRKRALILNVQILGIKSVNKPQHKVVSTPGLGDTRSNKIGKCRICKKIDSDPIFP